ncbi:XrtA system polysaccharide chain length determinant [Candidatus Nitrosacidococcus tergens]|uniref:Polysaccharide chain length determinant protein, PEP-CTERM locus subfamily n=1 Tax=Candidatus Nitrosacidococcus tergens TaxID=553981 RepID=A0A7G1QAN3_9GAMM|nr:XrtA system polysaccharide chain length determinant [Candidatus Nitrosacidococcus tergens]CAB1276787.1 Polysaccharide chain length determinant protein, PEP-CTERM locus subfamily [Candidatus Nitrosacidococcus tergens]
MHEIWLLVYEYWCGIKRYRWYGIAIVWAVAISGWLFVINMPDEYESKARVYVDTESLLGPLLKGLAVRPNIDQRLSIITRTLLSRPNLEKVVAETDMNLSFTTEKEEEDLVEKLQKKIKLGGTRDNLFEISYQANSAFLAQKVVQTILDIFVENTLGTSQNKSYQAGEFLDKQIKSYLELLNDSEEKLMNFKREHVGLMPNEKEGYYSRLQGKMAELEQAHTELKIATDRRDAIKRELSGKTEDGEESIFIDPNANSGRIQELQDELDELMLKYTDKHPSIVELQKKIDSLIDKPSKKTTSSKENSGESKKISYYQQQMQISLAEADAEIAAQKAHINSLESIINRLKGLVDTLPKVEAELASLTRDYGVYKRNYEELLERRQSAKMGRDVDESPESIKFRIIDPPTKPTVPIGPNRPLLATAAFVLSIGSGIAFSFFLFMLKPVFYTRQRFESTVEIPVLGFVSMILTPQIVKKQRINLILFSLMLSILIAGYSLIMVNYILNINIFSKFHI